MRDRIRAAIASLPPRERKVSGLYYYGEATMKRTERTEKIHNEGTE